MNIATSHENQNDVSMDDDDAELQLLEKLLAENDDKNDSLSAKKETDQGTSPSPTLSTAAPRLCEDSSFAEAFSYEIPTEQLQKFTKAAAEKSEELDSSDDEEMKNFLERKYNEYGSELNKQLKQQRTTQHEQQVDREVSMALLAEKLEKEALPPQTPAPSCSIKSPHNPVQRTSHLSNSFRKPALPQAQQQITDATQPLAPTIFADPVFGLRMINPLVSSALLVERMAGRTAVPFSQLAFHTQRGDLSKDWVFAGVLVSKAPTRTTKTGQPYSIWRISDLRGEIQMVSLFLFRGAHKNLWKTAPGMCLAVLNPSVFEKRAETGDVACLSIDTSQKMMILGQSKDLGTCKAHKRNGDACTATVNLSDCDYCIFHMKQEYSKMSRRSELQSATSGRGLNELRNKVLGKCEVFYGGQSFTAIPAKKSAKLVAKDTQRISSLSEYAVSPFARSVNHAAKSKIPNNAVPYAVRDGPVCKLASNMEACAKQRFKDLQRLQVLQGETATKPAENEQQLPKTQITQLPSVSTVSSTSASCSSVSFKNVVPDKFKQRAFSTILNSPKLSRENFSIEVNVGERRSQHAKLKAAHILKQAPIAKSNPNSIRGSEQGKRRAIDELNEKYTSNDGKRQKLEEEQREKDRKSRIQRIIDATSSHTNLIDMRERQEQEQYFNKLAKKEALEEKLLNTYKMPCKAVICQRCKYTAFSAAERCKTEQHPLKVVDAEKRFFACKDCGNRTTTVFKLPKISCNNCKGSRWQRTAMIRERKVCTGAENLSVRGDEEMFIGSLASKASLNLIVPDEE